MVQHKLVQFSRLEDSLRKNGRGKVLLTVPLYQRKFVWFDEESKGESIGKEFVQKLATSEANEASFFLGSLILVEKGIDGESVSYEVVDGQQRLATLFLIKNIIDKQNSFNPKTTLCSEYYGKGISDPNAEDFVNSLLNERGEILLNNLKKITFDLIIYSDKSDFEHSYDTMLDINRAHVLMLCKQHIISEEVGKKILKATDEIQQNRILPDFSENIEDLYTNLEGRLIKMVGMEVGGQQHTARSRNDLGATVVRMDTRKYYLQLAGMFNKMRKTILALARDNYDAVFSGYTHMQPSEPVSFAHYLSAVLAGLARDYKRYANVWDSLNLCPLGGCSMGSTSYNIDRNYTAKLLGFNGPIQNSIDCVASRDYVLETVVTLAMASDTMSRLAFDLYIWSTPEFGYIEVDDSCAVCSSIMPQKKNPFTLEHMKGLAGHMEGFVVGIYSCMKNIIYSHSKDTSVEATRYLYEAMHDMEIDFTLANITIGTLKVKKDRMRDNALRNFCTVTELANYLVRYDDISFRQAHHIVADVVGKLCKEGLDSSHIDRARVNEAMKEQLGAETKLTDELIKEALDPSRIAEAKKCIGGTSAEEVKRQLDLLEEQIDADEKVLADRLMYLAQAKEELNVAVKKLENS